MKLMQHLACGTQRSTESRRQSELDIASPQQGQHYQQTRARPVKLRLQTMYAAGRELGLEDALQA